MVEADFFHVATISEVLDTLREFRPLDDLVIRERVQLLPPIGRPQKILCIGRNYAEHARELEHEVPDEPLFFAKSPSALIGSGQAIKLPQKVGRVDFEGELAVVMGRRAKNISEKYAWEFVAGFTLLNDVTARDLQRQDIEAGKPWFRAKSFDTFCPCGPFLVPREAMEVDDVKLEVRVNGETKQSASTAQMVFSVPALVAYLSKFCTLEPGDLIATGTPAGVGPLQPGDLVECEIDEIGVLKNHVE
ncbi:MAG: FAA hydrolase family protein [Calditrichaeota bacterium]|nr:MAG: FAA hydrolase family protein [Calditrichota bacterium]